MAWHSRNPPVFSLSKRSCETIDQRPEYSLLILLHSLRIAERNIVTFDSVPTFFNQAGHFNIAWAWSVQLHTFTSGSLFLTISFVFMHLASRRGINSNRRLSLHSTPVAMGSARRKIYRRSVLQCYRLEHSGSRHHVCYKLVNMAEIRHTVRTAVVPVSHPTSSIPMCPCQKEAVITYCYRTIVLHLKSEGFKSTL